MGSDRGVESGFSIRGVGLILAFEGAPIVLANANKPVAKGFALRVCLIMAENKLCCILARKLLRFRKVRQGLLCQSSISLRVMHGSIGKGIMFNRLHGAILSKEVKGKGNRENKRIKRARFALKRVAARGRHSRRIRAKAIFRL